MSPELPALPATDDRACDPAPATPAAARPAEAVYDVKPLVAHIDRLRRSHAACAALQRRNLTILRGERRK